MPKKKNISPLITIFLIFAIFSSNSFASSKDLSILAEIVIKIAEYSKIKTSGNEICVFGNDELVSVMAGRKFYVIKPNFLIAEVNRRCKIIYFALDRSRTIRKDIELFKDSNAVTVSLIEDFIEYGGMILMQMGRKKAEIIIENDVINKKEIKLDSSITEFIAN